MINFSFSSMLMTLLISNLLLIIIAFCFRNDHLLSNIGFKLMAGFCTVILLRLLFPLELPFTKTLRLPSIISNVMIVFTRSYGTFLGMDITFSTVFSAIWVGGVLFFAARFISHYRKTMAFAILSGKDVTANIHFRNIINDICTERQKKRIRIFLNPNTDIPMIMGLRKPVILLPADTDPSDTNTLYALRHELYHYTHHDLWIKLAVNILTILYWWNPLSYILRRQVDVLLEMRVDYSVLRDGNVSETDYVNSLLHFVKDIDYKKKSSSQAIRLAGGRKSVLHHRVTMLKSRDKGKNYRANIILSAFFLSAYVISHLFIWEVYYTDPEVAETCIILSDDNCYAVFNENEQYDIYLTDGFYLDTTDTLTYYPAGIKVYESKEEHENEKP